MLLKKEIRELLTPQMLLPFVVVIALFIVLGQTLSTVGGDHDGPYPIVVLDGDSSASSRVVVTSLENSGFKPRVVENGTLAELARSLEPQDGSIVVGIPEGFEQGLQGFESQPIEIWTVVRNFSFIGNQDIMAIQGAMGQVNTIVAAGIAEEAVPAVPVQMLQNPISVTEHVIIGDQDASTPVAAVMSFVSQQTTFIPIVLFIVIIFAAQMIAVAVATEKENKTLETLLSYPVSRASIVTSKMVAAGLIALLSAGAYMFGMSQYMSGIEEGLGGAGAGARAAAASEAAMVQLGLAFEPLDYVLLGLTLFAGILVALSIAIILGAFAENVKSVQSLLTPLMVLLLIPYFLTLFLDLSVLPGPVRIAVMAIPFTYPFITGPALFLGDYGIVWFGILYQLLWFAVFVVIAARVFSSDRILTMKLNWGRKKR